MAYQHHPRSNFERRMQARRERAYRRAHTKDYPIVHRSVVTWRQIRRLVRQHCRQIVQHQGSTLTH